ncbi:hypothetical protein [Burkholderia gladioli]|nr:hypothetical protein [Burkholderia gladioli]
MSHRVAEAERAVDLRDTHREGTTAPTSTQTDHLSTVSLSDLGKGQIFR